MEQNLEPFPGYAPNKHNPWKFVKTGKNQEINLQHENGEYLLTPINIASEMREWGSSKDISKYVAVIVYGSALGYPIQAFQDWLKGDPSRKLIIVEESRDLFERFLELNKIEHDRQIEIYFLPSALDERVFDKVSRVFPKHMVYVTAIDYYKRHPEAFDRFTFTFNFLRHAYQGYLFEYLEHGLSHFKNFYHNILRLNESTLIDKFFASFPKVPAIIVGAGPSLYKNIELLKGLKDKALIIAGGTALNALNVHGIEPHLSLGVDPYESSAYRTLASTSFDTPYIFKSRMHKEALEYISGPLIYFPSGASYQIETWLHEELKYQDSPIELGTNVVNISLSLARAFGCQPLITVGVDLAYTKDERYSKGLKKHGTTFERLNTKGEGEEIIYRKDIFGKPVATLMKWIQESFWYSEFQKNHPDIQIINSTEGGIGFPNIQNLPLKMVSDLMLKETYDLDGWVHAVRVSSGGNRNPNELTQLFKKLLDSLGKLFVFFTKMEKEKPEIKTDDTYRFRELEGEIAYDRFLKEFENLYDLFYTQYCFQDGSPTELLKTNPGKFAYLKNTVRIHLKLIQEALEDYFAKGAPSDFTSLEYKGPISHSIENGFSIFKAGDHVLAKTEWNDNKRGRKAHYYFLNGKTAAERNFKNQLLEGLQTRFYPNGIKASCSHYEKGYLHGEVKLYYPTGKLRRELHFVHGKREGFDRIYSPNGEIVNESEYKEDHPVRYQRVFKKGQLQLELEFSDKGEFIKGLIVNAKGEIQPIDRGSNYDYFMHVADNTIGMTDSMNKVYQGFEETINEVSDPELLKELNISQDMKSLQEDILKLKNLSNELNTQVGLDPNSTDEPIWKTRETRETLQKEIQQIQLHFGEVFHNLDRQLNLYKKKKKKT